MIGSVLKNAREAINLSQSKVAEMIGVTKQTYLKWENDITEPKASQVSKLAKALMISENEICRGECLTSSMDELKFMKAVASIKHLIDDVTFISILHQSIDDKIKFLTLLEKEVEETHGYNPEQYSTLSKELREAATIKTALTNYDNEKEEISPEEW